MIRSIELEIVKMFVEKNKQERVIWELDNPKKRHMIMMERFASPGIFKCDCLTSINYMSPNELEMYLFRISGANEVYYIGEEYMGKLLLHQAALKANTGEICIIYCGKGIAYYQGEQEQGKPPRYLLRRWQNI